ncbi:BRCA1-associated RING domain protein 1-like isoform X1 [Zingiber officinale]|uniref:BRCA1-associated RING domain protein 1-like isoform X1 n=1 Tax=Zingiber officinale TaxID=94328 RepID=UPI001C4A9D26|nr:BRCA1-associated RING domain protein 1-like isoform X1 [Zingiber officinale]
MRILPFISNYGGFWTYVLLQDGKLTALEEANQPDGIYVHEKCVVWVPQVYFSEEIVKNFELELKQASKLKCSKCGLKGATLGCYDNNCLKSYHATCAVQIPDCRWDYRTFHVLCPSHSLGKLPWDDDSGKNNSTHLPSIQIESSKPSGKLKDDRNDNCVAAMDVSNEMIFMGSDLMASEKNLLVELASLIGGKVIERWTPEVTHVIVSTSECGACRRTYDFLLAVLSWKWILTTKWVKVSLELGHLVEEEPFEVRFDEKGFVDGPKKRRHSIIDKVCAFYPVCSMMFNSIIALLQSRLGHDQEFVVAKHANICYKAYIMHSMLNIGHFCVRQKTYLQVCTFI